MIKQFLGETAYLKLKSIVKRFWYVPVFAAYYLTNNWIIGNAILLFLGFKAGLFWKDYKPLVVTQGEAWKKEWGLKKNEGIYEDDSGSRKGYA